MRRIGQTIWITGLPSSGKTILEAHVVDGLARCGVPVVSLDGDELRLALGMKTPEITVVKVGLAWQKSSQPLQFNRITRLYCCDVNNLTVS